MEATPPRSYDYTDYGYTNCPNSDCTASYYDQLSGGTGKLTDGVIPTFSYGHYPPTTLPPYGPSNPKVSTNPYVGWYGYTPTDPTSGFVKNPTVTFYLDHPAYLDSVSVLLDNPNIAEVKLPQEILVTENGVTRTISIDAGLPTAFPIGPQWFTINMPHVLGTTVEVQFDQYVLPATGHATSWVMVGEVAFNGSVGTPEPATWLLIAGGLLAAGLLRRKRVN
jgi:hypothetical protein